MREIAFDTETTGLDPENGHKIVELGCVELVDRIRTGRVFHRYINPKRSMPKAAEEVHGLSEEFLEDKPEFSQVADEFLEFVGDGILVIHNASFDMRFVNYELTQINKSIISYEQVIDTLPMARKKFPGAKASLDALCSRYGISLERREKHGALLDAELLADVYIELTGGVQDALAFEEKTADVVTMQNVKRPLRKPRPFAVSQEELASHKQFLEKIKDPLWGNG